MRGTQNLRFDTSWQYLHSWLKMWNQQIQGFRVSRSKSVRQDGARQLALKLRSGI